MSRTTAAGWLNAGAPSATPSELNQPDSGARPFVALAAKANLTEALLLEFLLLPHATMANNPLSRTDAADSPAISSRSGIAPRTSAIRPSRPTGARCEFRLAELTAISASVIGTKIKYRRLVYSPRQLAAFLTVEGDGRTRRRKRPTTIIDGAALAFVYEHVVNRVRGLFSVLLLTKESETCTESPASPLPPV
jgi:hypothetical protein